MDDYLGSTTSRATLAVGGSRSGRIDSTSDQDWFRISLTAGTTYTFEQLGFSTGHGTLRDPILSLRNSSGLQLAADDDSGAGLNASLTYTPSVSGRYYIAADGYGATTGTYAVRATALDDFAGSTATTASLGIGSSRTGRIETRTDQDWFRIDLTAGTTYRFEQLGFSTGHGTLRDPILSLRNSSGLQLASNDDGGVGLNASLTYTPSVSGTYYLAADGYGATTGTYAVRTTALDDFAGSTATAASLGIGGSRTGRIESRTDQDWFRIDLTAGTTYRFEQLGFSTGHGTLRDPILSLRNSSGLQLASNDDGGTGLNASLTYTARVSGTYYIAADGYGATTGTYAVRATALDDFAGSSASTASLAIGGSRSGRIDSGSDEDWFRVFLTAGETYRFDQLGASTGHGTLRDPVLSLHTRTGRELASNDDGGAGLNASLVFTPGATGVYYISAEGFGAGTGSYVLTGDLII